MHYRVESVALPRAKTFKNGDKAVAFAKELAKKTAHEVRVVIVSRSSSFGNSVLYVFNRRQAQGDGS
jgi:hypothetical protein